MVLDIIVPHSNEPWEIVRPFFDIINSQKAVNFNDFRVMLVHDGVEKFPDSYFNGPVNVIQIEKEKKGVSAARNYGIDHSDAEWINFSDCDDCYSSIFALWKILYVLKKEKYYDLLWSPFYVVNGGTVGKFDTYNPIFIHNKYYRLSFLKEHDFRFCEELYMSEDSAFNMVVTTQMDPKKIGVIDTSEPLYSWCRREGSITMSPEKWISNVNGHFERNLYVLEQCRKNPSLGPELMVGRTITDCYSMLTKSNIIGDPTPVRKKLYDFYLENELEFESISGISINNMLKLSDSEVGISDEEKQNRKPLHLWIHELVDEFDKKASM